jgi:hypothetical protein
MEAQKYLWLLAVNSLLLLFELGLVAQYGCS